MATGRARGTIHGMDSSDPVTKHLTRVPKLAALAELSHRYRELDAALKRQLTPGLAGSVEVACVRENGELVVFAASGSVVTKLRSLETRLCNTLAADGWPVSRLKVRVRVDIKPNKKPKNFSVNDPALDALERTAGNVAGHPQLARALSRFIAARRAKR